MKILESYKKIAKSMLIEHAWDRKFGEPLPTLEDVAKKHQTEAEPGQGGGGHKEGEFWQTSNGWAAWRPGDETAEYGIEDKENAEKWAKGKIDPDSTSGSDDEKEPASKLGGGDFDRDGGEPEDKPFGGDTGKDADFQGEPSGEPEDGDEEPSGEKTRFAGEHMDDVEDSLRSLKQQAKELSAADRQAGKGDIKPPPELERGVAKVIEKIESGTMTDEDLEWAKESFKELRGQAGGNQYLEDMEWDLSAALKKHDSEWKSYESITIDGKQYRPIKDSVEPKKHLLREMYERIGGK